MATRLIIKYFVFYLQLLYSIWQKVESKVQKIHISMVSLKKKIIKTHNINYLQFLQIYQKLFQNSFYFLAFSLFAARTSPGAG